MPAAMIPSRFGFHSRFRAHLLPPILSLGLAACGGGGGGTSGASTATISTPAAITAQTAALWNGPTSSGRNANIVMLDGGRFYFLYSGAGDATALGGVITGLAGATGVSIAASSAIDFNWEGLPAAPAALSGSVGAASSFNGAVSYAGEPGRNFSFTSSYRLPAAEVVSLADVAGTYAGSDGTTALHITAAGAISGVAFSSDCALTGSVVATKNYTTLMHLSLTFQGGSCTFGASTVEGIAIYEAASGKLQGVALDAAGTRVALFQARKP